MQKTITEVHRPAGGRPALGSAPLCIGCPAYRTSLVGNVDAGETNSVALHVNSNRRGGKIRASSVARLRRACPATGDTLGQEVSFCERRRKNAGYEICGRDGRRRDKDGQGLPGHGDTDTDSHLALNLNSAAWTKAWRSWNGRSCGSAPADQPVQPHTGPVSCAASGDPSG